MERTVGHWAQARFGGRRTSIWYCGEGSERLGCLQPERAGTSSLRFGGGGACGVSWRETECYMLPRNPPPPPDAADAGTTARGGCDFAKLQKESQLRYLYNQWQVPMYHLRFSSRFRCLWRELRAAQEASIAERDLETMRPITRGTIGRALVPSILNVFNFRRTPSRKHSHSASHPLCCRFGHPFGLRQKRPSELARRPQMLSDLDALR